MTLLSSSLLGRELCPYSTHMARVVVVVAPGDFCRVESRTNWLRRGGLGGGRGDHEAAPEEEGKRRMEDF